MGAGGYDAQERRGEDGRGGEKRGKEGRGRKGIPDSEKRRRRTAFSHPMLFSRARRRKSTRGENPAKLRLKVKKTGKMYDITSIITKDFLL